MKNKAIIYNFLTWRKTCSELIQKNSIAFKGNKMERCRLTV